MENKRQTLGDNVVPLNYALVFEPNLRSFRYKGTETISVNIKKSTKAITLNSLGLNVGNVTITKGNNTQKATVKANRKLEQITFLFNDPVSGNVAISLAFSGVNGDKLSGFYKTKYKVGTQERYALTTQFEAPDARKAFPCFDEPALKATFELSFLIDKKLMAISNMPIKDVRQTSGKKLVRFQKSPKMSSYLVYFGIGEYETLKGSYRNIELNVVTTPGKSRLGEIALDYGKKFLKYYEDYFGIRYPLPKMDFIAVADYAIGGMENWGAITYSEFALLADTKTASVAVKQRIAELTAHELAHQWFGDLVTMRWWDDLWLNESFATFMSYKAVDHVFPEWKLGVQALLDRTAGALGADQLRSTQPIGVEVNSPADTAEAFDPDITYSKGGSVLVMLEDYVGKETFRKGLKEYMGKFAYSNATRHDLWESIDKAAGKAHGNVRFDHVASYWIDTAGYPLIDVNYSGSQLRLEQRRFLLLDKADNKIWPVPIHYIKKSAGKKQQGLVLLDEKRMQMKEDALDYIKLNYLQAGFYRVHYPDIILDRIGTLIKNRELDALDGWGVENDLYSMARGCRIRVGDYLDFIERYCMECEFPLNFSVSGHLNGLVLLLSGNKPLLERVKRISLAYHNRILERLGWHRKEGESSAATLLRSSAISSLGFLDDKAVVSKAQDLFSAYLKEKKAIDPNIRSAVYGICAWSGDSSTYDKFVSLYEKEEMPDEKIRFLRAIASFKDPKLVDKALKFTFSKSIRRQYIYAIPYISTAHEYGKSIIWKWIKANWRKLMPMFERGMGGMDNFVDCLTVIDDPKTRKEVEAFFKMKGNHRDDLKRSIAKTLERIDINVHFKEFNKG